MKKTIFIFSSLILSILLLFWVSQFAIQFKAIKIELVIGLIAILFFTMGIYFKNRLITPSSVSYTIDYIKLKKLRISDRELDVLLALEKGLTNKEIGHHLSVSESTIKTHVSNLFKKIQAKNRIEVVQKAKNQGILP